MYAQVDVIKKHFDRNNKAYQSLQVMDQLASQQQPVGTIQTAWEEQIWKGFYAFRKAFTISTVCWHDR